MEKTDAPLDWSLIRAVLAVADTGPLSAAARVLGQAQPTVGRQIARAEDSLGRRLFDRHRRGLTPTPFAQSLLPAARAMQDAARGMALAAAGEPVGAGGRVRITASRMVSAFLLPPIMARIRADMPDITLDLVASDTTENLLFHEADIAIRMYRPAQLDMVTRHLGDVELGFYATPEYLARHGEPATVSDLISHDLIGFDRDDQLVRGFRDAGVEIEAESFAIRTDDQIAYWSLVRAGAGIGVGQLAVARAEPGLRRVIRDQPLPKLEVWLTAHQKLRQVPRVARVWRALADRLRPALS